jgi:hypothetical protein
MSGGDQRFAGGAGGSEAAAAEVEAARGRVAAGHAAVQAGRYGEALRVFREALPVLAQALGEGAEEVVELRLDCDTVVQMAQVASLGRSLDPQWDSPVGSFGGEPPPRR